MILQEPIVFGDCNATQKNHCKVVPQPPQSGDFPNWRGLVPMIIGIGKHGEIFDLQLITSYN